MVSPSSPAASFVVRHRVHLGVLGALLLVGAFLVWRFVQRWDLFLESKVRPWAEAEVLRVELPGDVRAQMAGETPSGSPSEGPATDGDRETVPVETEDRSWWPWALGGVAGVAIIAVLLRSLRPR